MKRGFRPEGLGETEDFCRRIFTSLRVFQQVRVVVMDNSNELKIDDRWILDPKLLYVGPKIREGGNAKVYEGMYKTKRVAVKIIQPGSTLEQHARRQEKFLREVLMLCRVQHDDLIKFIGACQDPNMAIVTELLEGGSLKMYLRELRPEPLDLRLSINFALDISRVMGCLHSNGIIHRDLKPASLLLTEDRKKLKLADFGLAREESVTEMMTAETGTYRWMAPELYSTVTLRRGEKKHYTHKADIYSFSIVLWELLTNRIPFEGMSNLQAAYAAAFKKLRPSLDNLPKDLVPLLESCWAEDPNIRPEFPTITETLHKFLSSLPSPETAQMSQSSYLDSPIQLSGRHHGRKDSESRSSSHGFLGCFKGCFS